MMKTLHYLKALNYGNYGILLSMGNAGIISSTILILAFPISGFGVAAKACGAETSESSNTNPEPSKLPKLQIGCGFPFA